MLGRERIDSSAVLCTWRDSNNDVDVPRQLGKKERERSEEKGARGQEYQVYRVCMYCSTLYQVKAISIRSSFSWASCCKARRRAARALNSLSTRTVRPPHATVKLFLAWDRIDRPESIGCKGA